MEEKSRWKNKYAIKTSFDELDIDTSEITDIIRGTIESRNKYLKRAELKPMAKIRGDEDSHDTSRAAHMRQAAETAKQIAHRLGLNEIISYTGMLMHDAGHAFFGHEGEHTMNVAGKLLNTGYFHHNAKGIDVILSEGLVEKIINAIPEAKNNKKLQEELKRDAWYFLDVVVSHDGEATLQDNKIIEESNEQDRSIKEKVLRKVRRANSENIYKCNPETLESIISKPSDVIAYMKTDLLDAFSEKIVTKLDDDYLEVIGGMLCETREERDENLNTPYPEKVRQERIKKAQELLIQYRKKYLREMSEDIDKEKMEIAQSVLEKTEEKGVNIFDIYTKDDMEEDIKALKEKLKEQKMSLKEYNKAIQEAKIEFISKYHESVIAQKTINEILQSSQEEYRRREAEGVDSNTIASEINKIEEYTQKLTKERKRVVEEIMNDVQEAMINDYVETTKENWQGKEDYQELKTGMSFSKGMERLLFNKLKTINYKKYVQFTKREYQEKSVPKAVFKTVKECAAALVKTGVIRDKFYDSVVLSRIENDEVKKCMRVPERDEEEYESFKRKIGVTKGIKLIRPKKQDKRTRYTGKGIINNAWRRQLYKGMYSYVQTQDTRFAMNCEDVYYAIEHTVKDKVKDAYSDHFMPEDYLKHLER